MWWSHAKQANNLHYVLENFVENFPIEYCEIIRCLYLLFFLQIFYFLFHFLVFASLEMKAK